MFNSFSSCISNASKKFSWAPEMPCSKIISQPRMFSEKFKGRISFKQLQCSADRHCCGQFNKQMDVVNSNGKLVNFTSMFYCNFMDKPFAVNSDSEELERVHCIFRLPHKVEGILPEGMFKTLQIHFFSPETAQEIIAHANSNLVFNRDVHSHPVDNQEFQKDKFMGGHGSSLSLKAEVSAMTQM